MLLGFIILIIAIASYWKIFEKAGEPGWAIFIPIYNLILMYKIAGKPWWWIFSLLIPVVNIVCIIIMINEISKSFGHGIGFTLGIIFLPIVFLPILAFGDSKYRPIREEY